MAVELSETFLCGNGHSAVKYGPTYPIEGDLKEKKKHFASIAMLL